MKRVYQLLPEKWALENLRRRRMKVTRFNDLNDPFELLAAELSRLEERRRFNRWRRSVSAKFGLLCFSEKWENPLLWSHYADRHRGLCLGFDVPVDELQTVNYLDRRWTFRDLVPEKIRPGPLFCMKFSDWQYEEECRRIITLADARKDGVHLFWPFGPDLMLRQVIVGPRSKVTKRLLKEVLGDDLKHVELTRSRLAFRKFRVVTNLRSWKKQESSEGPPGSVRRP